MHPTELLNILHTAEKLKDTTRHCDTSGGRRESVAEHSWRIALMAFFLRDDFPRLDMDKVLQMCLIHDLGECFTGDIPSFLKTDADTTREDSLLASGYPPSPPPTAPRWRRCTPRWTPWRPTKPASTRRWTNWRRSSSTTRPLSPPGCPRVRPEPDLCRRKCGLFPLPHRPAGGGPR